MEIVDQGQEFRSWFQTNFPEIPPEFLQIYSEHIRSLPANAVSLTMPPETIKGRVMTRPQLLEEMHRGTDLGKEWARQLFEGTYLYLDPEEKQAALKNPQILLKKVLDTYQAAVDVKTKKKELTGVV